MTFAKGHWLDLPTLLLAHLGDDALKARQALISGFAPVSTQCREEGKSLTSAGIRLLDSENMYLKTIK